MAGCGCVRRGDHHGLFGGVYETDAWIADLLDWIRAAKGRTKLVGVCFGHQAMAQALGGRVEKSDRGWGVGLHRYQVASSEPWMNPAAATVAIPASHQDQVVEKPADARVLLRSDFTPFAGLAWGRTPSRCSRIRSSPRRLRPS